MPLSSKTGFCGMANPLRCKEKFRSAVAGSGSGARAKSGGVEKENRASWTRSQMTGASSPKKGRLQQPCLKPVGRRPLAGFLPARSKHSTRAGGSPPPRRGAEDPDLGSGSPPFGRNPLAAARRGSAGRVIDAEAGPRRLNRKDGTDTAGYSLPPPLPWSLPDQRNARKCHDNAPSPDNRGGTPDAIH